MQPVPFLSLVATSLSMRLVFEQGLFPYKFMALGVMLVLLAVVRGRVRGQLIVWLALLGLAFNTIPVGYRSTRAHGAITWRPRCHSSSSSSSWASSSGMRRSDGSAGISWRPSRSPPGRFCNGPCGPRTHCARHSRSGSGRSFSSSPESPWQSDPWCMRSAGLQSRRRGRGRSQRKTWRRWACSDSVVNARRPGRHRDWRRSSAQGCTTSRTNRGERPRRAPMSRTQ